MKKIFLLFTLVLMVTVMSAQQKLNWTYSAKKLSDNKYEIHLVATPPPGWHVYSQNTPDGGPVPTTFKFNKNALVTINGKVTEKGKLVTYFDENFKVNVSYFEGKADFVQVVTKKANVKTNISGEVESMICNDQKCLPPTTQVFNIALN